MLGVVRCGLMRSVRELLWIKRSLAFGYCQKISRFLKGEVSMIGQFRFSGAFPSSGKIRRKVVEKATELLDHISAEGVDCVASAVRTTLPGSLTASA